MPDEAKAHRWRITASDCISALSFAAICAAMLMTVGDIVLRFVSRLLGLVLGTNPGWGLVGLVDLTQLAMMIAAPLAIAASFICGTHIRVDLLLERLGMPARHLIVRVSALIGAGVMSICLYTAWNEMRGQFDFVTTSATLGIAYTWYWIPLICGLALSVLGCLVALIWPWADTSHDV